MPDRSCRSVVTHRYRANLADEVIAMRYFNGSDDIRLFYLDTRSGPPVVFVSSAWLNSRMWEFQIPYFVDQGSDALRTIAVGTAGPTGHAPATTTTR